jgi:hypothetical protein
VYAKQLRGLAVNSRPAHRDEACASDLLKRSSPLSAAWIALDPLL